MRQISTSILVRVIEQKLYGIFSKKHLVLFLNVRNIFVFKEYMKGILKKKIGEVGWENVNGNDRHLQM